MPDRYGAAQPIMDVGQKAYDAAKGADDEINKRVQGARNWMADHLNRLRGQQPSQPAQQASPAQPAAPAQRPGLATQAVQAMRSRYARRPQPQTPRQGGY